MADYVDEAHHIVDVAIENACKRLLEEPSLQNKENDRDLNYNGNGDLVAKEAKDTYLDKLGKIDSKTFAEIPNITWMSIGDFTVDGGLNKIEQFIEVCVILADFLLEDGFPSEMGNSSRYKFGQHANMGFPSQLFRLTFPSERQGS
jgi:hypothetical protein